MRNLGNPLLFISDQLARCSIEPTECIEAVEEGFRMFAEGKVYGTHIKQNLQDASRNFFLYAASVPHYGLGVKLLSAYEENPERGEPYIFSTIILLNTETGKPEAILDGRYITALRTAAATAISTRYFIRKGSQILGILGTGLQARTHLLCHLVVYKFNQVVIWGRNPHHVMKYINEMHPKISIPITALPTAEAVCEKADVISCTTRSKTPLFSAQSILPGCHINIVSPMNINRTEIPMELLAHSYLYVDSRERFVERWPPGTAPSVVAELGELVLGRASGRPDDKAITIFKAVGLPFEDVVTARIVLNHVREKSLGQIVAW